MCVAAVFHVFVGRVYANTRMHINSNTGQKKNEKRIHKVSESSRREGIINRIFTSVFANRSDGAAQLQLGAATKKF